MSLDTNRPFRKQDNEAPRTRELGREREVREILWAIPKRSTIRLLAGNDCGEPIETKLKQNGFSVNRPL